jgi:uncharacterized protein YqjF (DUF2071 family)
MNAPTMEQRLADRERPAGWPVMRQTWERLLFLHWRVPPAQVQRTLPPGLAVDVFDGSAWVGVVPFLMRRVRPAGLPALPGWSDFLELNVRTYVHDRSGRPGVWFYSLDCNRRLAVWGARTFFHLPYEHATMAAAVERDGWTDYAATRRGTEDQSRFRYRKSGDARETAPGSLEFFLVERYALYAHAPRSGRLLRGRVAHRSYRVHPVEVPCESDVALRQAGFDVGGRAPEHRCGTEPADVEVFRLERVG